MRTPGSFVGKFCDNGKPRRLAGDNSGSHTGRKSAALDHTAIDTVECKGISVPNKRQVSGGAWRRRRRGQIPPCEKGLRSAKFCSLAEGDWTSKFCRSEGLSAVSWRFNLRTIPTQTGVLMFSVLVVVFRLVAGFVILAGTWFVFDQIHDRNTEIIVATIGLLYCVHIRCVGSLAIFWPDGLLLPWKDVVLRPKNSLRSRDAVTRWDCERRED